MKTFLVLYRSDRSTAEQLATATPEQQQAGMQAWMSWFEKNGEAVIDGGAPTAGGDGTIGGYSLLRADSREVAEALLADHPHRQVGSIDVLECLSMPGR